MVEAGDQLPAATGFSWLPGFLIFMICENLCNLWRKRCRKKAAVNDHGYSFPLS